jgi:hypothetical protein
MSPPGAEVARVSLSLAYTTPVIAHNALAAPLVHRPAEGHVRPPLAPQRYQVPVLALGSRPPERRGRFTAPVEDGLAGLITGTDSLVEFQ